MSFDLTFVLNVIYPAASAAYEIMTNPNPALPPGYTLVDPIAVDKSRAAQILEGNAQLTDILANDSKLHGRAMDAVNESDNFGLLAYNAEQQTAIFAIRGTKTPLEWFSDFVAIPIPFIPAPNVGTVHAGFQFVYEHIRPSLGALAAQTPADTSRLLITGHSLGAALALLAAADLGTNQNLPAAPELNTFAGPRTGAPDFAEKFPALAPICYRVVNFGDLVPQVPLPPLYEHVGTEQLVHGGFRLLDPGYAHGLTTYLVGLQQLQHTQAAAPGV
jgi:predicted lipase